MAVQQSPLIAPRPQAHTESLEPPDAGMPARERRGYIIWGTLVAIILVTECLAAFWHGFPIPTISGTTGELEKHHSWVKVIILGGLVTVGARIVFYPWPNRNAED